MTELFALKVAAHWVSPQSIPGGELFTRPPVVRETLTPYSTASRITVTQRATTSVDPARAKRKHCGKSPWQPPSQCPKFEPSVASSITVEPAWPETLQSLPQFVEPPKPVTCTDSFVANGSGRGFTLSVALPLSE